jgi:hypothetical protein
MAHSYRHSAGFGKRMEYWIIGRLLKEGFDVYVPLVDDDAIDAVIRRSDGSFITVQIKARSKSVVKGDAALFSVISHKLRKDYWFIFYSERMDMMWIMSSKEFIRESLQTKSGKWKGLRSISLNGRKTEKKSGKVTEHCKPQFIQYIAEDFSRLK